MNNKINIDDNRSNKYIFLLYEILNLVKYIVNNYFVAFFIICNYFYHCRQAINHKGY